MKYPFLAFLGFLTVGCSSPQNNDLRQGSVTSPKEIYPAVAGELLMENSFQDPTVLENGALGSVQPQVVRYLASKDPQDPNRDVLEFSGKGVDFSYSDLPFDLDSFTLSFLVKVTNGRGAGYAGAPCPDYPIVTLQNGSWYRTLGITYGSSMNPNSHPMLSDSSNTGHGTSAQLAFDQWYLVVAHFQHTAVDSFVCETFDITTRKSINIFGETSPGLDLSLTSGSKIAFGYVKQFEDANIAKVYVDDVRLHCGVIGSEYLLSLN